MAVEDLFVDEPQFESTKRTPLGESVPEWRQKIIDKFYDAFPQLGAYDLVLNINKIDQVSRTAQGNITISISRDNKLYFPVVIIEEGLCPFDIFITENKLYPATPKYVKQAITGDGINASAVKGVSIPEAQFDLDSPIALGKFGGLLPIMHATITPADRESFRARLASDPSLIVGFQKTGMDKLVNQWILKEAAVDAPGIEPYHDIYYIVKKGSRKMRVEVTGRDVLDIRNFEISRRDLEHALPKQGAFIEVHDQIKKNGYAIIAPPSNMVIKEEEELDKIGQDKEPGLYSVMIKENSRNVPIRVNLFPEVKEYFPRKGLMFAKIACASPDGKYYAFEKDIDGVRLGKYAAVRPTTSLRGKCMLVKIGSEVMEPVKVASITRMPDDTVALECRALSDSTRLTLIPLDKIANIIPASGLENYPNPYYIPKEAIIISGRLRTRPMSMVNKIASIKASFKPVSLTYHPVHDKYSIRSDMLKDAGLNAKGLSRSRTAFILTALGANPSAAEEYLDKVGKRKNIKYYGFVRPRTSKEAQAFVKMCKFAVYGDTSKLKRDLIKEAAVIPRQEVVDKVLSLNFLNDSNINLFVSMLPELRKAECDLAQLLISSRLGLDVPETAIKTSMTQLSEVVDALEGMAAGKEEQETE